MKDLENLTRRELLKISGLSIAGITFLAACGAQSGVPASPEEPAKPSPKPAPP